MNVSMKNLLHSIPKNRFLTRDIIFFFAIVLLAISLAFIIVSSNYTALFLFTGGLIGLFLFGNPVYCFWVLFFSVFLAGGIISYFPEITTIRWGIVLLSLILGVRTIIEFAVPGENHSDFKIEKPFIFMIIFLTIGITSSLLNGVPITSIIISLKNYFQFVPVAFVLAILPQFKRHSLVKKIIVCLFIVALIQIPAALYQKYILGAQFLAMGRSSVAVQDAVSGTFANSLRGGASSVLSLYLLFMVGILISFAKNQIIPWRKTILVSCLLMMPILFNETKVSFIYISIIFLNIFKKEILKLQFKGIAAIIVLLIVISGLGYSYKQIYTTSDRDLNQYITSSISYNFGERGYGKYRLNRLSVLTFWSRELRSYDNTALLFGHGLDSANEGEAGIQKKPGHIAAHYPDYGIGLTMASRLLWETGIIGTVFFFMIFVAGFKIITRFIRNNIDQMNKFENALLIGLQTGYVLILVDFFNCSAFRTMEVYNFLVSLILGLTILMTCNISKKPRI
jgi:hypothetical protein